MRKLIIRMFGWIFTPTGYQIPEETLRAEQAVRADGTRVGIDGQ